MPSTSREERTPLKVSDSLNVMNSSVMSVQTMKMRPEAKSRRQMASFIFLRKKSIMVAMPMLAATETKLMVTPR